MEIHQLEYFVAVAEEGGFTRAAERLHISQSGVSAQVRRLERELGADLIDRSGRTATLTTAGVAALGHARAALASASAVRQAVDEVTDLIRGRIVVGMLTACTVTHLFDALSTFHAAHPGVEISLVEDTSDRLIEAVRAGVADLALVGTAGTTPPGLEAMLLAGERLVAAVPPDHPLGRASHVTLAEVSAYPIVCMPVGTGIRAVFDRACAIRGVAPTVALQASAPDAVASLAIRNVGVAILSESMVAASADQLTGLVIDDVEIPAILALVWRLPASPALRELLVHGRKALLGTFA